MLLSRGTRAQALRTTWLILAGVVAWCGGAMVVAVSRPAALGVIVTWAIVPAVVVVGLAGLRLLGHVEAWHTSEGLLLRGRGGEAMVPLEAIRAVEGTGGWRRERVVLCLAGGAALGAEAAFTPPFRWSRAEVHPTVERLRELVVCAHRRAAAQGVKAQLAQTYDSEPTEVMTASRLARAMEVARG